MRNIITKGIRFVLKNKRFPSIYEVMRYANLRFERMPLPQFAQVEITTRCNLQCITCSRQSLSKSRLNRDMTAEEFRLILKSMPLREVKLQGLGEPFLCRNLPQILEIAKSKGIRVTTITNGSFLPEEDILANIDSLTVSFDASRREAFEHYRRGASFERILENVAYMVEAKRGKNLKTQIGLSMVVTHLNFEDMEEVMKLAWKLGVDFVGFVEVENWYIPSQPGYEESSRFIAKERFLSKDISDKVKAFRQKYDKIAIHFLDSRKRKHHCF